MSMAPAFSVLDLSPITVGSTAADALRNSLDLARHAERLGYTRVWVAEHHNFSGIASSATSVLIGHLAGGTSTIRVGSGGIMLPNHSPLMVAEQFGTLEALYPGRIDLGIGRAPGTDQATARALRRNLGSSADTFTRDLLELQAYLGPEQEGQAVRAIPGQGSNVPIYMLGSSDFGARLAAQMGLPFAFASHFAPDFLQIAIELYRATFQPSAQLDKPHVMVGMNVIAADTDEEAERLFTTPQQAFLNLIRGRPGQLPAPLESSAGMESLWNADQKATVLRMLRCSAVGSPDTVQKGLQALLDATEADEFIATAPLFDHGARLRSLEIAAGAFRSLQRKTALAQ